ncbi:MAG: 4Fe-4S dicluster domain-containing protein [Planctomycetota bacterium]|nr:MAG: 4Fe-4S dicluster domain-containing protein [Planctomycetota bacterium]
MATKRKRGGRRRKKRKIGPGYAMLADMSRCSNCGTCMMACKEYNDHPPETTELTPTGVNPPDISSRSVLAIHAFESVLRGQPYVRFQRVSCYHCGRPACHMVCPVPDCITIDVKTRAVIMDETRCAGCRFCVHACPFEVPRMGQHPEVKDRDVAIKCNFCYDRLRADLKMRPACARACPTGALIFGKRKDVVEAAESRLAALRNTFGQEIGGRRYLSYGMDIDQNLFGLGIFMILEEEQTKDYRRLALIPKVPAAVSSWKGLFRWTAAIVPGIVIVFAFLHYMIFGPLGVHVVEEEEEKTFDEMTPEEQTEFAEKMERQFKMKQKAGKAKRLYQPMPIRRARKGGKGRDKGRGRGRGPRRRRR